VAVDYSRNVVIIKYNATCGIILANGGKSVSMQSHTIINVAPRNRWGESEDIIMSKKNIFITNGKDITIGKGKIDLSAATPEFKEKVQLFADGINKMNDKALYYSDCVRTATHSLELYEKGTYVDSSVVDSKKAEIEKYQKAAQDIRAEIQAKMPDFDKTDKNLYYAYRQYTQGEIELETYVRAFAEFFDNAGVAPTSKGIDLIISKIGVNKASAKSMCKNGGKTFTNAKGEKQFLDLVYRVIADLMYAKGILKEYKYEYVIVDKKAKKTEPATTEKAETTEPTTTETTAA
jgi:hypothetical protein